MRSLLLGAGALAALTGLSSCATYEPCTRDWFEFRADQIQRDFVRRNRGEVRRLRTLQSQLEDGMGGGIDVFAVLALASAKKDVRLLVDDFREFVVPQARAAAATCELDSGYDVIVTSFLAETGVDARVVEALQMFGALSAEPVIMQAIQPGGEPVPLPRGSVPGVSDGVVGEPGS